MSAPAPSQDRPVLLEPEAVLLPDGIATGTAVLVADGAIAAIGPATDLVRAHPAAERMPLAGQVLMPGFVNAHQHGGGLKTFQLGARDDLLEPWLFSARRTGMDVKAVTQLAALDMIASGVTAVIHANTAYGTGDFANEIRSIAQAFDATGLRAMVGIGARDRGEVVYPASRQPAFLASLPADLRDFIGDPHRPIYAGDAAATVAVMDRMQREFAGHPRITFAYAPAGPQWVSDGMLADLAADAAARNVGVHMHGLESHLQAVALAEEHPGGFLAHLETLGALSPRLSLAHAVWLTPEDTRLAARHGVTLVRNAGSNLRLRVGIAPVARYLEHGVNVAMGTDSMTLHDDEDFFKELRLVAGLARSPYWDGPPPLGPAQMTTLTTRAGARAMLGDGRFGAIAVGQRADVIGVSLARVRGVYLDPDIDLLAAVYTRAMGTDVRLTMIDGRVAYRDGVFPGIDRAAIAERVASEAARTRIADPKHRAAIDRLRCHVSDHYRALDRRLTEAPWAPWSERPFGG